MEGADPQLIKAAQLGYLLAFTGNEKPPKVQVLHLPVGGRRMRPTLEDVIDFAVRDLGVEAKSGWQERIESGRKRWRRLQVKAALRDVIRDDPAGAPDELRQAIEQARRAVLEDLGVPSASPN